MKWSQISKDVRDKLLRRRDSGELVEDLAVEMDMRPSTLDRRLREHAALYRVDTDSEKGSKISYKESVNTAEVSVDKSDRIKTLDQLIDAAGIDLDEWAITDWGVKKWEVGAKSREGHLVWDDGRIVDGELVYEGLEYVDLWSVWAKLARTKPIPLHPVIKPVECNATLPKTAQKGTGLPRAMIIADTHFGFYKDYPGDDLIPFHSRDALDIALQIAVEVQPDDIYIIGDFFDLVMWSDKFLSSPRYEYTTQPAINEGHWWLRQFRLACPSSGIIIHEGNHDARMKRAVLKHLRAAYGLRPADELDLPPTLSPQRLLALHKLDVEWINNYPSDRTWLNNSLCLEHGNIARKDGGATSKAHVSTASYSVIFGHVHRKEMSTRTIFTSGGRKAVTAYSPGCVCRVDGVVPGSNIPDWHQGIALIDYTDDDFAIHDIPISNGTAIWNGSLYKARDVVSHLVSDMPEWKW